MLIVFFWTQINSKSKVVFELHISNNKNTFVELGIEMRNGMHKNRVLSRLINGWLVLLSFHHVIKTLIFPFFSISHVHPFSIFYYRGKLTESFYVVLFCFIGMSWTYETNQNIMNMLRYIEETYKNMRNQYLTL